MNKNIFVSLLSFILLSCTNSDSSKNTPGIIDTASPTPVIADSSQPKEDTIVWVGLFAEWVRPTGVINGNYDTARQIFLTCELKTPVNVPRDNIRLLARESCQIDPPRRVLMMIKKKDSLHISDDRFIRIDSAKGMKPSAIFKNGSEEKKVTIEPQAVKSIKRMRMASGGLKVN